MSKSSIKIQVLSEILGISEDQLTDKMLEIFVWTLTKEQGAKVSAELSKRLSQDAKPKLEKSSLASDGELDLSLLDDN